MQTELICQQLDRILESQPFSRSPRMRRFLRLVVERTLSGDSGGLKEYSIGRDVFDRPEDYDPRVDAIVRVEARRLRKKVEEYYATAGQQDPVRFLFRGGSYAPAFYYVPEAHGFSEALRLAVLPFSNLTADRSLDTFCQRLTESACSALGAMPDVEAVPGVSVLALIAAVPNPGDLARKLGAGAVLKGFVHSAGVVPRLTVDMLADGIERPLWSATLDCGGDIHRVLRDRIAAAVGRARSARYESTGNRARSQSPEAVTLPISTAVMEFGGLAAASSTLT